MKDYDFGGWATKNDIRCSDGRTIRHNAFKENDGKRVPLVWQHDHKDPFSVIGHADLENREEGVYTYCKLNSSDMAKHVGMLIEHGDLTGLSIYANQLKQSGGDVIHGNIREVSVVLAGANPGACIEFATIAHGDGENEEEATIYSGEPLEVMHADETEQPEKPEQSEEIEHADEKETGKMAEENNEKTVKDVVDSMTEEQRNVMYYLIGQAIEDKDGGDDKKEEGEPEMVKHNLFDNETQTTAYLTADDYKVIFSDAKRMGSLRDAVMAHMAQDDENGALAHAVDEQGAYLLDDQNHKIRYGMANMNYLFPDYKTVQTPPEFIKRDTEWVNVVMGGVHHTPFSRIKSIFANITMDEARARGYVKGNLKKDEIFSLLKRTTDPQTIYKKQKLDRDDIIDITDFDVVAFIKSEMRTMLDEEIARAILIGDGRLTSDDDHISDDHIRPIWTDAALYTIQKDVTVVANDESETAKNFIRAAIKARVDYKGSGNPVLFTTESMLTDMLLIEDGIGHLLYANEAQLATMLRVSKIVTVPVMENQTRNSKTLAGIIVNLKDYNVGADKGGAVAMFDDFDIDYNQQKYLIETRCSGALIKPYSAIVLELVTA
jgi:HK97 family phage prohead protease